MNAIENIASIYFKFYDLLYNGVIDEDTISINDVKDCIKYHEKDFNNLCEEIEDTPISDREQAAFYLTMNFVA